MFRINLEKVVESIENSHPSLETAIQGIQGKLFMFAQQMWLKGAKNNASCMNGLLDSNASHFFSKRKSHTIIKRPKYFTFLLEYGKFFRLTSDEIDKAPENYRRYLFAIL